MKHKNRDNFSDISQETNLTDAQFLIWLEQELQPDVPLYNAAYKYTISGEIDPDIFQKAFQLLIDSSDALRTVIQIKNTIPCQQIIENFPYTVEYIDISEQKNNEIRIEDWIQKRTKVIFNMEKSLLDSALIKLSENKYVWFLNIHHIIRDRLADSTLFKRMSRYYENLINHVSDKSVKFPQFSVYMEYEKNYKKSSHAKEAKLYWENKLAKKHEPIRFYSKYPENKISKVKRVVYNLTDEQIRKLKSIAMGKDFFTKSIAVSLYNIFLAIFSTYLYRMSGNHNFFIETPHHNRRLPEFKETIGLFMTVRPLQIDIEDNDTFLSLTHKISKQASETLKYAKTSIGNPQHICDVSLNYVPFSCSEFNGMAVENKRIHPGYGENVLDLRIVDNLSQNQMFLKFDFDCHVFDDNLQKQAIEHFLKVMDVFLENNCEPLNKVSLLSKAEEKLILIDFNDTKADYPKDKCIHQLFEEQVIETPDNIAVVFPGINSEQDEDQQLTYAELNSKANQLAHHLQTLGVGTKTLVGICVERSLEMIIGLLGILKAGGAYVPLDPAYPKERLAYMLSDTATPVLLTESNLLDVLPEHNARIVCLDTDWGVISKETSENVVGEIKPENLAYVLYTSGSTGKPKGVAIEHHSPVALIHWAGGVYSQKELTGMLASTSICFDLSVYEIFFTLCAGGKIILVSNAIELANLSNKESVSLINTVPSAMEELVRLKTIPDSVQTVNLAGESLLPGLVDKIYETSSVEKVYDLFGPSEDTTYSTFILREKNGPKTIGSPISNTQIYILDTNLKPVPIGISGEIHITGAGLARGYLNRPELTAEKFIPNPFSDDPGSRLYKTGDLAQYLPDGNIEFLGRMDHQVKIRGFRIELGEIEAFLSQHPKIRELVVITREDKPGDKRLIAYLCLEQGEQLSINALRGFLKTKLPDYMIPSAFVFLKALPLTPNGKVDRKALPAPDPDMTRENKFVGPRNETEKILAHIWAQVLGTQKDQISMFDNFFEIGGHSLLATQVVSRIQKVFKIELSLRNIFKEPNIDRLGRILEHYKLAHIATGSQQSPISQVSREQNLPLSFAQQRLWFLDQLEGPGPTYNILKAFRISGQLNVKALEKSINEIVRRHESLRTNFVTVDDKAVQVIQSWIEVKLELIDLSGLDEFDQEEEIKHLVSLEAQKIFNLSKDQLIRATLLQSGKESYVLLLSMHHIVSDGWSIGIFFQELKSLYSAFRQGESSPLAELAIQYADFAYWQREWLAREVLETQLKYWQKQLANAPALLELPTDKTRPAVQTFKGTSLRFKIDSGLTAKLNSLCQKTGTTMFMLLESTLAVLLSRYSNQTDILIGTPIANRTRLEIENLIGFFVNTLVMQNDLKEDPEFSELLEKNKQTALDAYANQDVPFEKVVDALDLQRQLSYSPLFQVMFAWQNAADMILDLPELTLDHVEIESTVARFDLTLFMKEEKETGENKGTCLTGTWEYNTDLFNKETIQRMANHFQTLLQGIVSNPTQKISKLPFLTEQEKHQLLVEFNDTITDYPKDKCIHQLFEEQVIKTPDNLAVVFPGINPEQDEDQQLTYAELNSKANQLAHHLQTLGVGTETLVGICVNRSLEMIIGLLGILKAGGAYVPLDPAYPKERLAYMLSDTATPVLLTQEKLVDSLPEYSAKLVCLDTDWEVIGKESSENVISDVKPENLVYVIYTSGSTGKPKGINMSNGALFNLLFWQLQNRLIFPNIKTLQFAPISFDVHFQEIFSTFYSGGTLVLISEEMRRDTAALLQLIQEKMVGRLFLPFIMLQQLAQIASISGSYPVNLREIITAGEQLQITPILAKFFKKLPDCTLENQYGPSESHVVTAFTLYKSVKKWKTLPPIGRPISNTQIYITDNNLNPVPIGVPGELHIGGAGLARGYLNRPELTAEKFIPNPFSDEHGSRLYKTGDLCRYLPDGNIEFIGRIDNQVKIRGFRIELGEIETVLGKHSAVKETVVITREDQPGDKRLVAYLCLEEQEEQALSANDLRSFLKTKLPDYMVPSAFVVLDKLPLTPNGKIDRKALPMPDLDLMREQEFVAPRNETEEIITNIWKEVLHLEKVSVHDNFFEIGGNSLLAIQLLSQIQKHFSKHLLLATLFQAQTIVQQAELILQNSSKPRLSQEQPVYVPHPLDMKFFPPEIANNMPVLSRTDYASLLTSLLAWKAPRIGPNQLVFSINHTGSKEPFFWCDGSFLRQASLAKHLNYLDMERGFYALTSGYGFIKLMTQDNLKALASIYVNEITAIQPDGPYFLGGHCGGGQIAFEMAKMLHAQGRKLALLVVLEVGGRGESCRYIKHSLYNSANLNEKLPYMLKDQTDSDWDNIASKLINKNRQDSVSELYSERVALFSGHENMCKSFLLPHFKFNTRE